MGVEIPDLFELIKHSSAHYITEALRQREVWPDFLKGLMAASRWTKDDAVEYAKALVNTAGGENKYLFAIVEKLLVKTRQVSDEHTGQLEDIFLDNWMNVPYPPDFDGNDELYQASLVQWREGIFTAFVDKYKPESTISPDDPRVAPNDIMAGYGLICGLVEKPASFSPFQEINSSALRAAALKYIGVENVS